MRLSQIVGGVLLVFCYNAFAQDSRFNYTELEKGPYAGIAYLHTSAKAKRDPVSLTNINTTVAGSNLTSGGLSAFDGDDKNGGWGLQAGYRVHPNVAIEFDYGNLGSFAMADTVTVSATVGGNVVRGSVETNLDVDIKQAMQLGMMINTPLINDRIVLFGKIGYGQAKYENAELSAGRAVLKLEDDTASGAVLGVGALVRLSDRVSARIAYEDWRQVANNISSDVFEDFDMNILSAGLQFRF